MRHRAAIATTLALLALGVVACGATNSDSANRKADALVAATQRAGVAPNLNNEIARVLYGDDGGRICGTLEQDQQPTTLGLARTRALGQPEEHVSELVTYDRLIIKIYCPDQSGHFDELLEDLNIDQPAGG